VHRVATRLGLVPKTDAARAQRLLEASVPHRSKTAFHMGLIAHGRQTCSAQRPKCSGCVLLDLCPTGAREG
ncbi:MAG: endonuclease III domain-containing protein, partial [Actinomycetota bacterium]